MAGPAYSAVPWHGHAPLMIRFTTDPWLEDGAKGEGEGEGEGEGRGGGGGGGGHPNLGTD